MIVSASFPRNVLTNTDLAYLLKKCLPFLRTRKQKQMYRENTKKITETLFSFEAQWKIMKHDAELFACQVTSSRALHTFPFNVGMASVQAYLGDIAGSVPDQRNKASRTNILVCQGI
jgi:hypothetical protein